MGLKRVGVLLFGFGLCLSLFTAVAFGFVWGSTEAFCGEDHDPTYTIESIDVTGFDVTYSDGCNRKSVASPVVGGGFLAVAALVVGLAGILQDRPTAD